MLRANDSPMKPDTSIMIDSQAESPSVIHKQFKRDLEKKSVCDSTEGSASVQYNLVIREDKWFLEPTKIGLGLYPSKHIPAVHFDKQIKRRQPLMEAKTSLTESWFASTAASTFKTQGSLLSMSQNLDR